MANYIGIIMDGNRRWARQNKVTYYDGYRKGIENCNNILLSLIDLSIFEVSIYAMSYDNYVKRPVEEVDLLVSFLNDILYTYIEIYIKYKIIVKFIGERDLFSENIKIILSNFEERTYCNDQNMVVNILLGYNPSKDLAGLVECNGLFYSRNIHAIDTIIRTGGYNRLSGFLPMQSMYANIITIDTLWPDFTVDLLKLCLQKSFINNYGI